MMMTQTIRTEMQRKGPLVVVAVAALVVLSLSLLAAPRPAGASIFYTIYTVNQTTDAPDYKPGDNICDIALGLPGEQCTLRAAIQESNATAGTQVIHFDIPGTGVHTISPKTELPEITDAVSIDGYSQPGSSVNTLKKATNAKLMIELDGAKSDHLSSALRINAPNVVVKGLVINNRFYHGIVLEQNSVNSKVEGNFIGTDPSGTLDRGLVNTGVLVSHSNPHVPMNITIGGSPAARNLISGNGGEGIFLGQNDTAVYSNLIGTKRDGKSPLGNGSFGVWVSGNHNVVGGSGPGAANTIAFNGKDGVLVPDDDLANVISSNSIFSNKGLGINLGFDGSTPNDIEDPDTGANNLQNKPVLSSAKKSATGKTTIKGKLNSTPNKAFTLQFFKNRKGTDEGKTLLFSKSVSTDESGNAFFTFSTKKAVALGNTITATAANNSTWDTSEFSAPRKVVAS